MRICIINRVPWCRAPVTEWLAHEDTDDLQVTLVSRYVLPPRADSSRLERFIHCASYDDDPSLCDLVSRLHKKRPFDRLVTFSEADVLRVSRLRDLLGIHGQDHASATLYRDKIAMKRWAASTGVNVPEFSTAHNVDDVESFIRRCGLPIIVKPRDSFGSQQVTPIRSGDDWRQCRSIIARQCHASSSGMDVEQFIEGNLYHADGVLEHGELRFLSISLYLNSAGKSTTLYSPKNSVPIVADCQIDRDSTIFRHLSPSMERLMAQPRLEAGTVHAEWIVDSHATPWFVEIASRTGGLLITDTIERKYGFGMNETSFRLQCGLDATYPRHIDKNSYGFLIMLPRKGILTKLDMSGIRHVDGIIEAETSAHVGERYDDPTESTDHIGQALFTIPAGRDPSTEMQRIMRACSPHIAWTDPAR